MMDTFWGFDYYWGRLYLSFGESAFVSYSLIIIFALDIVLFAFNMYQLFYTTNLSLSAPITSNEIQEMQTTVQRKMTVQYTSVKLTLFVRFFRKFFRKCWINSFYTPNANSIELPYCPYTQYTRYTLLLHNIFLLLTIIFAIIQHFFVVFSDNSMYKPEIFIDLFYLLLFISFIMQRLFNYLFWILRIYDIFHETPQRYQFSFNFLKQLAYFVVFIELATLIICVSIYYATDIVRNSKDNVFNDNGSDTWLLGLLVSLFNEFFMPFLLFTLYYRRFKLLISDLTSNTQFNATYNKQHNKQNNKQGSKHHVLQTPTTQEVRHEKKSSLNLSSPEKRDSLALLKIIIKHLILACTLSILPFFLLLFYLFHENSSINNENNIDSGYWIVILLYLSLFTQLLINLSFMFSAQWYHGLCWMCKIVCYRTCLLNIYSIDVRGSGKLKTISKGRRSTRHTRNNKNNNKNAKQSSKTNVHAHNTHNTHKNKHNNNHGNTGGAPTVSGQTGSKPSAFGIITKAFTMSSKQSKHNNRNRKPSSPNSSRTTNMSSRFEMSDLTIDGNRHSRLGLNSRPQGAGAAMGANSNSILAQGRTGTGNNSANNRNNNKKNSDQMRKGTDGGDSLAGSFHPERINEQFTLGTPNTFGDNSGILGGSRDSFDNPALMRDTSSNKSNSYGYRNNGNNGNNLSPKHNVQMFAPSNGYNSNNSSAKHTYSAHSGYSGNSGRSARTRMGGKPKDIKIGRVESGPLVDDEFD